MIFDFNIPFIEFRFRLQLFCRERLGLIFKFLEIDLKIPWFKHWWHIYKHWKIIEIGYLGRSGCYRVTLFNYMIRDYYDKYPTIGEINGQKTSSKDT